MFDGGSDFGYFGKGLSGYSHYMQSFNSNFGNKNNPGKIKPTEQKNGEKPSETGEERAITNDDINLYMQQVNQCLKNESILSAEELYESSAEVIQNYYKYYNVARAKYPLLANFLKPKYKDLLNLRLRCYRKLKDK